MKILLYKDLIVNYLSRKIADKNYQKQIKKMLDNDHSVWLYSKQFLLFLKEELGDEYEAEFQDLATKFLDGSGDIETKTPASNFDAEFINIWNTTQANAIQTFSLDNPNMTITKAIPNICILSKQQKTNCHWLGTELAILHPNKVTVSCHDFNNNSAIDKYFDNIFSLARKISDVSIFDTQCNFDHKKFDYLIKNKIFVRYYTVFNKIDKQDLKRKFPKCNLFTTKNKNAHGRRIIFENFIIHCDNDFWNLEINAADWCIDVQYSEAEANQWLSRCNLYHANLR